MKELLEKKYSELNKFSNLTKNWDGYRAKKIDKNVIRVARKSLLALCSLKKFKNPFPGNIVPVPSGNVQFEWDVGNCSLEIELYPIGQCDILKTTLENGKYVYEELETRCFADSLESVVWILNKKV